MVEPDAAESGDSKRRSRTTIVALAIGVVVVGALVAYGLSRSSDDNPSTPTSTTTGPTIGIIQAPAEVDSTQPVVQNSAPATADVPVVPPGTSDIVVPPGTADIALPPVSADIVTP